MLNFLPKIAHSMLISVILIKNVNGIICSLTSFEPFTPLLCGLELFSQSIALLYCCPDCGIHPGLGSLSHLNFTVMNLRCVYEELGELLDSDLDEFCGR